MFVGGCRPNAASEVHKNQVLFKIFNSIMIQFCMLQFLKFLLCKSFLYGPKIHIPLNHVESALKQTIADSRYNIPGISRKEVIHRIQAGGNETAVFLYRLGHNIYCENPENPLIEILHSTMRECCACEIYFSNQIGVGFEVIHGVGMVLGSRNIIGNGFKIFQGCTIGHRNRGEPGAIIGSDVVLYANSAILGRVRIGDHVVIGSNSLVMSDIPSNSIVYGNPAKVVKRNPPPSLSSQRPAGRIKR